ncbi:MAG: sigma-70 family RNA polymerase sigma factor [Planctomycetes bacterium]|nr:sigma-70 family RNA polymerase sigma factor [Planctomycetota bacterium]
MPIDPDQLGKLLDGYWAVLVAWVGGSRDGAEDVVQSAFIKLATEEPPPSNCVAWLFTVSKRLAVNERLSSSKRRLRESHAVREGIEPTGGGAGFEIQELLNSLEKREREIILARIWGGLTFDEIAAACGDSKATVWRSYQSGISKLKNAYGELENE